MNRELFKVEICANSVQSCREAKEGGADRVELCAAIPEGGTTPSYGEISLAREIDGLALNVIIRPRGSDFLYSADEIESMVRDIRMCREIGVDGVVFGALDPYGNVDMDVMSRLMDAASGLSVTFHRAFDHACDPFRALEDIISLGCDRILTSGQRPTAVEGIGLLGELVAAAGDRIIIMPGCGVKEDNIARIAAETGAREFHFSARRQTASGMVFRNNAVCMGAECDEFVRDITVRDRVRNTVAQLLEL